MLRLTTTIAVSVWAVTFMATLWLPQQHADESAKENDPAGIHDARNPVRADRLGFLRQRERPLIGYALNLHYNDDRQKYLNAVDEIAALGCNAILIPTPAFQTNGASTEIRIEVGPGRGPYRDRIIELARRAKQRGLTTVLMPTVLFTEPRGSEWRGKIVPDNWDRWWKSYERMTDHFVAIANEADVDIYIVGSELLTTDNQGQRWRRVIERVRNQFDGAITYSGNFDAYADPTFWDELDLIAMNAYFDLVGDHESDHPPMEHLVERWQQHRKNALAFAKGKGKPLLFTEMGYPSAPWGLRRPWEYIPYDDTVADHAVQRDGYQAFFSAWLTDLKTPPRGKSSFAGVFFYEWDPYRSGEPKDSFYGIRGKPTHEVVRSRLHEINHRQ